VRIALGRIKEEIQDLGPRNMCVLRRHVCEDDSGGRFFTSPSLGSFPKVLLTRFWEPQQPENGVGNTRQYAQPRSKCGRFNLFKELAK
jgi:hypothetical protein